MFWYSTFCQFPTPEVQNQNKPTDYENELLNPMDKVERLAQAF